MVNFKQQKKGNTAPVVKNLQTTSFKRDPKNRKNRMKELLILIVVLVITAFAFGPTLNNKFVDTWDDGVYVTDNMTITKLSKENIKLMFTKPINGTYVPLPLLTLALEYKYFKLDPRPYHIHNLALHLICVILVFYILLLLGLNPWFAAFAALLFGIHPMRVESVAWVTERKDLVFSVFYLSALVSWIYTITRPEKKTRYYLLTLLFFVLSLFSKIQAVTLPLSLLLLDYYFNRPLKFRLILEKIPHWALSLGFGLAGIFILEKTGSLSINATYSLYDRVFFGLHSLWIYIVKIFYPDPLSCYYPYPFAAGGKMPWNYLITPLYLVIIAAAVFLTRKKTKAVIFGSLFFLFNVMFLLQILGAGTAFQADRFTYIPYLGVFFMFGWAIQTYLLQYKSLLPIIITLMVIASAIFFTMTIHRSKDWKDSESIWSAVIEDYPDQSPTAYANRASFYRNHDQWPKAVADYTIAIKLDPNPVSVMNRGNLFFDLGKLDSAFLDYKYAMAHKNPTMEIDRLYANIGAVYATRQNFDSALYYLNLSIEINARFPNAYLNRALVYEQLNKRESSIEDYKKYIEFKPDDDRVYSSVGVCLQYLGRFQESIGWFEQGMAINPKQGLHFNNRSYSYNSLGDKEKAKADVLKARDLGFAVDPNYLKTLGIQ